MGASNLMTVGADHFGCPSGDYFGSISIQDLEVLFRFTFLLHGFLLNLEMIYKIDGELKYVVVFFNKHSFLFFTLVFSIFAFT
jgi:hypothetical protein